MCTATGRVSGSKCNQKDFDATLSVPSNDAQFESNYNFNQRLNLNKMTNEEIVQRAVNGSISHNVGERIRNYPGYHSG